MASAIRLPRIERGAAAGDRAVDMSHGDVAVADELDDSGRDLLVAPRPRRSKGS